MTIVIAAIYIFALVCFLAAAVEWPGPPAVHPRLIALGLFLWLLGFLIQSRGR